MSNISLSLLLVFKISISLFLFCMLLRKRLLGVSAVKSHGTVLWSTATSFLAGGLFVRLLCDPYNSVCLPFQKKLCRFRQDRAKQDLKVKFRGFYRRKALGVACAAVPLARQLHYCPSLSYFRNKASSLPHEKCWSGTFHTPPFTALELKRSSCKFSSQKHPGQVECLRAKRVIGTDSVGYSDLSSELAGSRIYWLTRWYLFLPFRFSSVYQQHWRRCKAAEGLETTRLPEHSNLSLVFENLSEESRLFFLLCFAELIYHLLRTLNIFS